MAGGATKHYCQWHQDLSIAWMKCRVGLESESSTQDPGRRWSGLRVPKA
ncbi:hypothetical protein [Alloactinosynnema sp. L-07]|nr:hypothetical protein [Alloactinosynnema sp. L-07]